MTGPLVGIRVLDFGQYIAGPLAAMLLADMGADVVHIDPPGGPRYATPANATWNRGKRSLTLDLRRDDGLAEARHLAGSADVLIENFRPGVMDRLGLGADRLLVGNERLLYCSLPGFASDDPRANMHAWEGVVAAATGTYSTRLEGDSADQPVFTAIPIASSYAAFLGATSIAMALNAREQDGLGQKIEVPLFDATFTAIGVRGLTIHSAGTSGLAGRASAWVRQYACKDGGWVQFHAANTRFIQRFMHAAGVEEWETEGLVDRQRLAADPALAAALLERMRSLFKTRTAQEWEDLVNAAGTPTAISRASSEWLDHPHARGSQAIVEVDDPQYGRMLQPGLQVRLSRTPGAIRPRASAAAGALDSRDPWSQTVAAPGRSPTDQRAASRAASNGGGEVLSALRGVKVLDLCIILAGPTCGRTLAEFGAEVIKIDDPHREGGVAFHQDVNRAKRSILLDLKSEAGRDVFWSLVDGADVIVQNYRDGVVQRLGIDYESVRNRRPDIVYASLNAYGHVGPWADRPGWEQLAQAASGMQARYGGDGQPVLQPFPVNDYGTGIMGAFAVALALYHRRHTGVGQHVQTALAYTAGTLQSLFLQDFAGKVWDEPRGQQALGWNPLQRLYRTSDSWFFLAARVADAGRLAELVGLDPNAYRPQRELETALEGAFARAATATWIARLTEAGIAAERVATVADLMQNPWVRAHGLSLQRQHDGVGLVTTIGPAPRLSRTPVQAGRPAPRPGADAESILGEVGLAADLPSLLQRDIVRVDSVAAR